MAALAERRIIPHEELKARSEGKSEAQARAQEQAKEQARAGEETGAEEAVEAAPAMRPEHMRLLEALLFAASAPLDEKTLAARLPEDVDVKQALRALQMEYAPRGVNLVRINSKWTFRTAADLSWLLTKEAVVPKKLSRAA